MLDDESAREEQALMRECEDLARVCYRSPQLRVDVSLETPPDDDMWKAEVVEVLRNKDTPRIYPLADTRARMTKYHRGSKAGVLEALRDGLLTISRR